MQLPLKARIFFITLISSIIPLLLALSILHYTFINSFENQIARQALDIASLAATRQDVISAYASGDPSKNLQEIADEIRAETQAVFVVFMDMKGIRYTHPDRSLIGLPFSGGDEGPALRGQSYTSKAVGVSGLSIRAFRPILRGSTQVGVIAVGFFQPDISMILSKIYNIFYFIIPFSLALIICFSFLLAGSVKKIMFGMEPLEIATRLQERETIIHSVKEGIIAIDQNCKITMINQTARNLFPVDTHFLGRDIRELIPDSQLPAVMDSNYLQEDQQLIINNSVVMTNRVALTIKGKIVGAIATFRPLTEVNKIAEELTGVKKIVAALRARTHEYLNKLHVILGLINLEALDEARSYISEITFKERNLVSFLMDHIQSSTVAGLLMGKASEAEEKQIRFMIDQKSRLYKLPTFFDEHAMVIVLGNLIENAFDSLPSNKSQREVSILIEQTAEEIKIEVSDSGSGIPDHILPYIFDQGFTTKKDGQGLGLFNLQGRVKVAGGKVIVISRELGTTFRVIIPYNLNREDKSETKYSGGIT
ncbi:MAG: sensor histidine kinase [Peptococcaceae bacterium]|nr:sensor histidine kinase [Peptococcaceae bacterium]